MQIFINKNRVCTAESIVLSDLVHNLGLTSKRFEVKVNSKKISNFSLYVLKENDNVVFSLSPKKEILIRDSFIKFFANLFLNTANGKYLKLYAEKFKNIFFKNVKVEFEKFHISFHCPNSSLRARTNFPTKEPETIAWIDKFSKDEVLWDIGANIGFVSLYAGSKRIKVFSFEPLYENFALLTQNIVNNKLSEFVKPFNIALSKNTVIETFYIRNSKPGSSGNSFQENVDQNGLNFDFNTKYDVVGFSVDDFIKIFKLSPPTYIKLDVDGNELDILKNAKKTLSDSRVKSIMVEISILKEGVRDEIIRLLSECGFELFSIAGVAIEGKDRFPFSQKGFTFNHLFIRT